MFSFRDILARERCATRPLGVNVSVETPVLKKMGSAVTNVVQKVEAWLEDHLLD